LQQGRRAAFSDFVGPNGSDINEGGRVAQLGGLGACDPAPHVGFNETQKWCAEFV
jgi:hypothetical protein